MSEQKIGDLMREQMKEVSARYLKEQALSGWRPIETAPKDGTRVIGWAKGEDISVTYFDDRAWRQESEVYDDGYGWSGHDTWKPTHWQPLPRVPYPF